MPQILAEFKRVLRPGGRLVLLNMSKANEAPIFREKLYKHLLAKLVVYLMGGCRPVLMEKLAMSGCFTSISRTFLGGKTPSEIVLGANPVCARLVERKG